VYITNGDEQMTITIDDLYNTVASNVDESQLVNLTKHQGYVTFGVKEYTTFWVKATIMDDGTILDACDDIGSEDMFTHYVYDTLEDYAKMLRGDIDY